MIKLIDLTYYTETQDCLPSEVLNRHSAALGFVPYIKDLLQITIIKHLNYEGSQRINAVNYAFFKSRNRFKHIPFKTHRYIKALQPDIVLVQGLIFPLQVLALRITLGRKIKIMVQHHGGDPGNGIAKLFQKMADRCITAYLFTSINNADKWLKANIIPNRNKCSELLEASTAFTRKDVAKSRSITGLEGEDNFLWVGRLNANKDPFTVLHAFEKYTAVNTRAKLYMIYQSEELLPGIKLLIDQHEGLKNAVILKGKVYHEELPFWYSAASFYISGSHSEGSGYALIEAMSCGTIPVVTNIPSYKKITGDSEYGFLFEKGNINSLFDTLCRLQNVPQKEFSESVIRHFRNKLSFQSIAKDLHAICVQLVSE